MNTTYLVMQVHCSDFNIICNIVVTGFTSVLIHIVHVNIKCLLIYLVFAIYRVFHYFRT